MTTIDGTLLRDIEVATVFCLSGVLLLFSGGDARRVLRYWAAAGVAFCVREWTSAGLTSNPSGLLWEHAPWPLISQSAEHLVLVALVAGAHELRGGARITRSALGVFSLVAVLLAQALVSIPGLTTGAALAWRGAIAVTCAAAMLVAVALLRTRGVIESKVGRRVLLVTLVLLAAERLVAGYDLLARGQGWSRAEWFAFLPAIELMLIVVGLVATVVVLLEREQWVARQGQAAATRAELTLNERESYFAQLIESATDIITVLDETATIVFESPAVTRVLGWDPQELLGRSALAQVHPDDRSQVTAVIGRVISGHEAVGQARYRYRAKDGTWRLLESEGREMAWDGPQRRFIVATRDVTDRELLEQRLIHAGKMESIGRLAGGVAHDFNNLLTVIMSNAALAQVNPRATAAAGRELDEISGAAARAARLTSQLLAFSRRQVVALQSVDLHVTLPALLSMLHRVVGERIELAAQLAPGLPAVMADPGQVDQVITNLVLNARDAMPEGGKIHVAAAAQRFEARPPHATEDVQPGPYVCLRVRDTGPGIPPEVRDHLFEPFFTTKELGSGTGLGLATCYGIVRRHGGHIWYEDAPGGGAEFVVCLPVAPEATLRTPPTGTPSSEMVRGTESILLVEDDAQVRATTQRILVEFGYQVETAEHGEDALRVLAGIPLPALVVSDVVMPHMDGVALVRRLRDTSPDLPVVLVSGYNEHADAMDLAALGRVRYVSKPYTPLELLVAIRSLLDASVTAGAR